MHLPQTHTYKDTHTETHENMTPPQSHTDPRALVRGGWGDSNQVSDWPQRQRLVHVTMLEPDREVTEESQAPRVLVCQQEEPL